jgi:UDP-GlcNAc:undecaprenyl-phosphate GlcNAc-1-phosphate transferase
VILGGGYLIEQVTIFGFTVALQGFALPVTLVWFVMIINAVNLLDGMDGMLGSIAVIVLGSLALMALATSNPFAVLVSSALAGSLLGFLRFNLPPASVYLGDCGSMLIGLTIAAVSVHASIKGPAFAVLVPTGLLVLPIMDTTAAIVRRKLTGRGLAVGDRGHIHHVLQRQGLTTRRVLVVVVGLGILASVGAVSSTWLQNDLLAIAMASGIVLMLIAAGLFGNAEMQLIRSRAWGLLLASNGLKQEMEVRLQGSINWSELWDDITQTAQVLDLESIWLDVNAPRWHEGYHRRWKRPSDTRDELSIWKFELPLMGQGQIIGRLVIFGRRDPVHSAIPLEELSALVHRIELTVERLTPSATDIVPVEHDTTVAT